MKTFLKWMGLVLVAVLVSALLGPHAAHATTFNAHQFLGIGLATVTLGNYNETFFAQEALIQLEKVMGMAGRVYRDYNVNPTVRGETIKVRRPAKFTAQSAPSTAQDVATESVDVTVDQWDEVKFYLTDKDLSLSNERIISDHIRPAAVALADKIDQNGAALYKDVPWYTTLTSTPVLADIGSVRKVMFENKVPLKDKALLSFMIDGAAELAFVNALAASGMQPGQQDPSLREGSIGRLYGFDVWANQNTPSHTSGVGADAVGAVDYGSGSTAVYAAGLKAMHVDGLTSGITLKKGDSFAITGHTTDPYNQRYVLTADGTNESTGDIDIAFEPGLVKAVDENTVVTFYLGGASKAQNLAFHRNAFCLATAPLSELGGLLGARVKTINDPITGMSLRSRMFYDGDNSRVVVALDVLYGWKTLDRNLAVRAYAA